jgi:hypothetical protein
MLDSINGWPSPQYSFHMSYVAQLTAFASPLSTYFDPYAGAQPKRLPKKLKAT